MSNTNMARYFRYLMLAFMMGSVTVGAISCDDSALVGPVQPIDGDDDDEDGSKIDPGK